MAQIPGMDLNARGILHWSRGFGLTVTARALQEAGADPNVGASALLEAGANPNGGLHEKGGDHARDAGQGRREDDRPASFVRLAEGPAHNQATEALCNYIRGLEQEFHAAHEAESPQRGMALTDAEFDHIVHLAGQPGVDVNVVCENEDGLEDTPLEFVIHNSGYAALGHATRRERCYFCNIV